LVAIIDPASQLAKRFPMLRVLALRRSLQVAVRLARWAVPIVLGVVLGLVLFDPRLNGVLVTLGTLGGSSFRSKKRWPAIQSHEP
jgi:hypothetical protein